MSRYEEVMNQILEGYKQNIEGILEVNGESVVLPNSVRSTESPIEELLYIQLKNEMLNADHADHYTPRLTPQYKIKKGDSHIRVDFLYELICRSDEKRTVKVVIECDGHDYHEKTKEQARRDKSRDRFLLNQGFYVMRFTGSEIYKNPRACTAEINDLITEKLYGEEIRSGLLT